MAHSLSANKRIRQSIKRRARNRARKDVVKGQVKSFLSALSSGDVTKAKDELNKTVQRLDKTAAKRTIHRRAASRKRSRLQLRLNAMIANAGQPAKVEKKSGKGTKAAKASS
ncbi:30S ribosomal protein S20 [soil metagenome]